MNKDEQCESNPARQGALAGIRVIDLTSVLFGPMATQILGDYGADVIKIEPLQGDGTRPAGVSLHPDKGSIYLAVNRNKRSAAIDLKTPEGQDVLWRLLENADILVHNIRMSAVARLGFGYDAVAARYPRLVYCAATGFGQEGPDRDKPAYDDIIQSACGLASLNGEGRNAPDYVPTVMADKTAGLVLVNAMLAALLARERTGRGQFVEVPMFETMVAFMLTEHLGGLTFDPPAGPAGYARLLAGGRRPVPTKDGYVTILPYNTAHWTAFFKEAGRPELSEKYSVADGAKRNANVRKLYAELALLTPLRTSAEWMRVCKELDIPATPIFKLDELFDHPHLKAVGMFESAEHPTEGPIHYVRPPARFSDTPARISRHAASVGEHTTEILKEAGYENAQIEALRQRGAVA